MNNLVTKEDIAWLSDEDAARYCKDIKMLSRRPMKKILQQLILWLFMWPLSWLNELGRSPQKDKN